MSIAFNRPLATVDGNVFRVWTRLNNDHRDIKLQSTRKSFEKSLNLLYKKKRVHLINQ